MKNYPVFLFLMILLAASVLPACAADKEVPSQVSAPKQAEAPRSKKQALIQKLILDKDFMGIFKRHEELSDEKYFLVSEAATAYINACCQDLESALQLLRDHDFKIGPNIIDAHDYREQGYDEVYAGENSFSPKPHFYTSYKVMLFIKEKRVQRVVAKVDRHIL